MNQRINIMQLFNRFKKITAFTMIILMVGACTGDFEEMNTNPTLLTEDGVQTSVLFTSVLKHSIFASYENTGGRVGEFSQYYASQASGNLFSTSDYTSPFNWYRDYIININEIIRLTADDPQKTDQNAMARIWKVWVYHMMTDAYGDIPYFEAALGVDDVINQPKYDTQEAIYTDMLNELKEAATQLGSLGDQESFGNADILYQGNVESWEKLANSLRLRLAIRVRFANESLASQHITDVVNAPLIDKNSENASLETLPPSESENSSNVNFVYNRNLTATTPMFVGFAITDVMIPTDDPRMPVFFTPSQDGEESYRGRPIQLAQGQKEPYGQEMVASVGPLLNADIYEIIVMNAAEVFFLRAEAAFANITGEDAEELYLMGIQHSMEQYNVDESEVADFLNEEGVVLEGSDEEQFEKIVTQKYIAMFFQGYQGWAEMRRTGYPKVWIGDEKGVVDHIPRRFTYPNDEFLKNEENVAAAASAIGGDELDTKVWWDKRPGLPFEHPMQDVFPPN
jgi:hypothetical protein